MKSISNYLFQEEKIPMAQNITTLVSLYKGWDIYEDEF
jgi:hypothetical protein